MSIIQGNAKQGSTRGFYNFPIEQSLRFNDDDSAYLSWTPASAGNRKTWTWSGWVKRCELASEEFLFDAYQNDDNRTFARFDSDDKLTFFSRESNVNNLFLTTSQVFRDVSAWYHLVFYCDFANTTAKIYVNGVEAPLSTSTYPSSSTIQTMVNGTFEHKLGAVGDSGGTSGYFSGYLAEVNFIDGTALTADSFGELKSGVWIPKDPSGLTYGTNGFRLSFADDAEVEAFNTVLYRSQQPSLGVTGVGFKPDLVITKTRGISSGSTVMDSVRGASAMLSTASTGAESTTGGKGIISFDSDGFTLGTDADIGSSNYSNGTDYVAWCWDAGANNAVTGHSSVTYTGNSGTQRISGFPFRPDLIWIKARNTASFYHHISDSVRGFDKYLFPNVTLAEETNTTRVTSTTDDGMILGNKNDTNTAYNYVAWAWDAGDGDPVSNTNGSITSTVKASQANGFSIVSYQGTLADANIGHGLSSAPTFIIIKNRNRSAGTPWVIYHSALGASQRLVFADSIASSSGNIFGSTPTAPDADVFYVGNVNWVNNNVSNENDHIAYCFHDVTGKQKFGTYTGDGGTSNSVTTGFRPGFVMIKRTDGAANWEIYDSTRESFTTSGQLYPNTSDAEGGNHIQFDSNGFTLTADRTNTNENTGTYIYAAFAGSYSDYITDYNTDGTNIDSRVKANQTTGFSIVSYEGSGTASDSFGHGLGTAPSMVIIKDRQLANSWLVQHSSVTGYLTLNSTNAVAGTDQLTFGASTVTLNGTWDIMNGSGRPYIAYCWAEKTGYSKFGSYSGSGSAPSSLITTGFKPAFVMIKEADGVDGWGIYDGTRNTSNPRSYLLQAQDSGSESSATANYVDFESTGFKVCTGGSNGNFLNESGKTYIYAAFADTREAAFWLDQSGNDNDWQPVNLDHNDTVADSPTNNFCTLNPVIRFYSSSSTLSDGNLKFNANATGVTESAFATFPMTSGQWYAECTINSTATGQWIGVSSNLDAAGRGTYAGGVRNPGYAYKVSDGNKCNNSNTGVSYGPSSTVGDVIGIAMDADNGSIEFFKNGSSMGVAFTGMTSTGDNGWVFGADSDSGGSFTWNFGQQPFKYDPPA